MIEPYYQEKDITIYNADCKDVISQLDEVDCVITDPPFSKHTHKNCRTNKDAAINYTSIDFDSITIDQINNIFNSISVKCKGWIISFMEWRYIVDIEKNPFTDFEFMRFGVWLKTNPMPQISGDRPAHGWDGIIYLRNAKTKPYWNGKGKHGNFYYSTVADGLHPTAKPLPIIRSIVENFTKKGDTILDPFMGSGTTLRACKDLGRKGIGIELDKKYVDIAIHRLKQEVFNF